MATLHVRDVPDALYESLRRCAEENGRSIGGQAIALLNEALSSGRRGFPLLRQRTRGPMTPFQAFDHRARSAIVDAQALARELGHDHVGDGHILTALLAEGSALAEALGGPPYLVTREAVRERVRERVSAAESELPAQIPFAPAAKKSLELALRESVQGRSATVEPRHLLLGVAAAGGLGSDILAGFGLDPGTLRAVLLTSLAPGPAPQRFKVVELEGTAGEWEAQLDDAASGVYELVQIVGTRAILALRRS